jgi:hypothetical protein
MSKNITTIKGWTITAITWSASYYTLTLSKGNRTRAITVDADQLFDAAGARFNNNL